jgi:phospholipid transport system transporter-binding protein
MPQADRAQARCRLEQTGDGRYALLGDLGIESAAGLLRRGEAAFSGQPEITVDLSGVTDADSAGLAVLIEWVRGARGEGRQIRFLGMPARLGDLARIGGVNELLPVEG